MPSSGLTHRTEPKGRTTRPPSPSSIRTPKAGPMALTSETKAVRESIDALFVAQGIDADLIDGNSNVWGDDSKLTFKADSQAGTYHLHPSVLPSVRSTTRSRRVKHIHKQICAISASAQTAQPTGKPVAPMRGTL